MDFQDLEASHRVDQLLEFPPVAVVGRSLSGKFRMAGVDRMSTTATMVAGILATLCCSSAMAAEPDVNHPALAKFILESLPAKTGLSEFRVPVT